MRVVVMISRMDREVRNLWSFDCCLFFFFFFFLKLLEREGIMCFLLWRILTVVLVACT